jgi:hypothetical protein
MLTLEYADACVIGAAVPAPARVALLGAVDRTRRLYVAGGQRGVEAALRTLWPGG